MTRNSTQTTAKTTTPRNQPSRQSITFELVARLAPHQGLADNLVRTFGLEPVDYEGIRDPTGGHIASAAKVFGTALNERPLQIHLQRITHAFVGSAFGAAQFYGTKKSAPMELTSKLLNDDRDGPAGFEQGRARPPVRRRDAPAVLCSAGCRRASDLRLRRHHGRGLEAV